MWLQLWGPIEIKLRFTIAAVCMHHSENRFCLWYDKFEEYICTLYTKALYQSKYTGFRGNKYFISVKSRLHRIRNYRIYGMHDQSCRNDRSWFGKFLEIKNKNDLGCWCKLDLWHNNFKDIYKKMEIIVVCAKCESLFLSKNKKNISQQF